MTKTFQRFTQKSSKPYRFAVVMAEFNRDINDNLLAGVVAFCSDAGLSFDAQHDLYTVPGSYEIPLVSGILAKQHRYDAIITLGTLIQGDTDHYQAIMDGVSQAIWRTSLEFQTPIIFGILMVHSREQAQQRSLIDENAVFKFHANYGYEWAHGAYQTLLTIDRIEGK